MKSRRRSVEAEAQKSLMSSVTRGPFIRRFPPGRLRNHLLSTEGLTALLGPWASGHVGFWALNMGRRVCGWRDPSSGSTAPAQVRTPEFQGAPGVPPGDKSYLFTYELSSCGVTRTTLGPPDASGKNQKTCPSFLEHSYRVKVGTRSAK